VPELEWKMTAGVLSQTRLRPNINGCQKGVTPLFPEKRLCLSRYLLFSKHHVRSILHTFPLLRSQTWNRRDMISGFIRGGQTTRLFVPFESDFRSSPRSPEIEPSNMLRLRALIVLAFVASASALLPAQTVPRSASLVNKLDAAPR